MRKSPVELHIREKSQVLIINIGKQILDLFPHFIETESHYGFLAGFELAVQTRLALIEIAVIPLPLFLECMHYHTLLKFQICVQKKVCLDTEVFFVKKSDKLHF